MPKFTAQIDTVWIIIAGIVLGLSLIFYLIATLSGFFKELSYLNMEIGRASEKRRAYYMKKKKRLYLSLIPFVRYK